MYPLLETIRIKDGKPENIDYHYDRMVRSLKTLFGSGKIPPLKEILGPAESFPAGIYKCRVVYSADSYSIEFHEYQIKKIDRLVVIEKPDLSYEMKFSDRSVFEDLSAGIDQNTEIIISRKGLLTDTRYTNIALLKNGIWHTPAIPLLEGTCRARLLERGIIKKGIISIKNLREFSRIRLFNAMIPWEESIDLQTDQIEIYD